MIINSLSALNVLHQHFGHDVTFQDAFAFKLIVCGLRSILGVAHEQKLPITPEILLCVRSKLMDDRYSRLWVATLVCFYSFFHKSSLVPKSAKDYAHCKTLLHKDILVHLWGLVICMT